MKCRSGGIGRRARFRFVWLTPCGFESHLRHFIFIYKLNRYGTKNPNAKHSGFERERAEGGGIDVCQFRRPVKRERPRQRERAEGGGIDAGQFRRPVKRERPRQSHLRHLLFRAFVMRLYFSIQAIWAGSNH